MQKRKLIAMAAAAAMLVSTTEASHASFYCPPHVTPGGSSSSVAPWIVIGCAGGIILAAFAANYRDNRELTAQEAWSCGLLFLASKPNGKRHRHHRHG